MSLSAPVTVQVREYVDPTCSGVTTLDVILIVMVGSGDEKTLEHQQNLKLQSYHSLCTVMVVDAESIALSSVALHVYVPA